MIFQSALHENMEIFNIYMRFSQLESSTCKGFSRESHENHQWNPIGFPHSTYDSPIKSKSYYVYLLPARKISQIFCRFWCQGSPSSPRAHQPRSQQLPRSQWVSPAKCWGHPPESLGLGNLGLSRQVEPPKMRLLRGKTPWNKGIEGLNSRFFGCSMKVIASKMDRMGVLTYGKTPTEGMEPTEPLNPGLGGPQSIANLLSNRIQQPVITPA